MKIEFTTGEGIWRDIQLLQPDNFKVNPNYDAIEKSFRVHGFRRAFDVWVDENGVIWSIDGAQRKHVLETRFKNVPDILPFNFHKAENIEEAKIILVNVFNQRESKVDYDVYSDWIPESDDLIGEVDFDMSDNSSKLSDVDNNFDDEIRTINDSNVRYPIVPNMSEKHTYFIILCDNKIDEAYIRNRLDLETKKISTDNPKDARLSNVLTVEDIKKL